MRSVIGVAVVIVALVGCVIAYGYWTANGSGSGTVTATTTTDNLTIASRSVTGSTPGLEHSGQRDRLESEHL